MKLISKALLVGFVGMLALFLLGLSTQNGEMISASDATITEIAEEVELISDHIHGVQYAYPNLATAVSITSTNDVTTWTPGADTQVIPAATVTSPFDIHYISIGSVPTNGSYQLDLYQGADGAGTKICSVTFSRVDNFNKSFPLPVITPIMAANTRVYGKLADSADDGITVTFKVWYHTY